MKRLKEIMTRDVRTIEPTARLKDAARLMDELSIGMMPVSENGRIIGTITDRDIVINCVAKGGDVNNLTVRHAMSEGVETAHEDDSVDDAARLMGDKQIRRLIVLNSRKELAGVVAMADLATHVRASDTVHKAIGGVSEG
ncbi:CBS domain-containing protein [Novispirillum sp. DQ9]|uniref:CBS domain-containing protein n=1 Tax=Novispirillum sp. DQ9 TaxID=3398612 RepID=UPI003C7A1E1A